jgi:hypothetical protein
MRDLRNIWEGFWNNVFDDKRDLYMLVLIEVFVIYMVCF